MTWVLIFQLAALFAALDSCLVLFKPTQTAFIGLGLPYNWATGFTILLILVYLTLIDYALAVFYPNAINEIILNWREKANFSMWAIAILTLVYCIASIAVTVSVSLLLRHTSASMSIQKPNITAIDSLLLKQNESDAALSHSFESDIADTKNERSKAISQSQRDKGLQVLADKNNGWAIGKLKERAKDAAYSFDKKVGQLQEKKTALLASNAQNFAIVVTTIHEANTFKIQDYAQKANMIADFLMWLSIGATGFQCFAGLMIALYRANHKQGKIERLTPQDEDTSDLSEDSAKEVSNEETPKETVETEKTVVETVLEPKTETETVEVLGQKATFEKPVERSLDEAKDAELDHNWVSNLKTIELDGETYTPSEIIKAKSNIIVYHKRSLNSIKEETREENRIKTEKFKRVLEMTGLTVRLYEDGTGKVFI